MNKYDSEIMLEMKEYLTDLEIYVDDYEILQSENLRNTYDCKIRIFRYIAAQIINNVLALDGKLEDKILPEYLADCRKLGSYSSDEFDFEVVRNFIIADLKGCIEYINKVTNNIEILD